MDIAPNRQNLHIRKEYEEALEDGNYDTALRILHANPELVTPTEYSAAITYMFNMLRCKHAV